MTNLRVWHASRDPYHCSFRFLRLLVAGAESVELERLRILDMFLLYPSLLHRSSLPQELKNKFRALNIEKPHKIFMHLPSPAAIFQDLRLYQNSATIQLAAKGLIDSAELKQGTIQLLDWAIPSELRKRTEERNIQDQGLSSFLVGPFSNIPLRGSASVYRRVGLPTRVVGE
tara:strand:+ start:1432 stop:1947 length:516 start_codon:yes stop_codon:yes gene_type:complete